IATDSSISGVPTTLNSVNDSPFGRTIEFIVNTNPASVSPRHTRSIRAPANGFSPRVTAFIPLPHVRRPVTIHAPELPRPDRRQQLRVRLRVHKLRRVLVTLQALLIRIGRVHPHRHLVGPRVVLVD